MKRLLAAVYILSTAVFCCTSVWSQVIQVDPNTPEAAAEQRVDDSNIDERLAQKVTYTATDKRLHTVLEELTAMTGVTIRCGKNDTDWQVRDLPVIVCARDIPLGKLLRAIGDCTHLGLTAFSINDVRSYRLWQDAACRIMLNDYYAEMRKAKLAEAEFYWKTWYDFGKMPDSRIDISPADFGRYNHCSYEDGRAMAKILAALPEDIKKQAFNAGQVRYAVRDLPDILIQTIGTQSRWCYEYKQQRTQDACALYGGTAPSESGFDLDAVLDSILCIDIALDGAHTEFRVSLAGKYGNRDSTIRGAMFSQNPEGVWMDFPMPPSGPVGDVKNWMDECGTEDFSQLWPQKIKLDEFAKKEKFTRGELLAALADASGFTFVSEDYECIRDIFPNQKTLDSLAREIDSVEVIRNIASTASARWFASRKDKVCVGFGWNWVDDHGYVISEDLLQSLKTKLNGPGLELDDAASAAASLTSQQMIAASCMGSFNLNVVSSLRSDPLWCFYGKLNPEDKKAAKSEAGLPLAKFDLEYVRSCFIDAVIASSPTRYYYGRMAPFVALPTDPDLLCKLSLRLKASDARPTMLLPADSQGRQFHKPWPEGVLKTTYNIELVGDDYYLLLQKPSPQFPIYSREREQELWKQMQAK